MPPTRAPTGGFTADLRGLSAELLITLAGLATSAATVALNFVLLNTVDFDVLSLTYIVVLPAGAIVGGIAAASGYYLAARATHTLPNRRMLFEMLAIALSTWFLAQWLAYALLRFPSGAAVRDVISFWEYFQLRAEHAQFAFRGSDGAEIGRTSQLGLWGYASELVQVGGFLLGGLVMWSGLKRLDACVPCARYARVRPLLTRVTSAVVDDIFRRTGIVLPELPQRVKNVIGSGKRIGFTIKLADCPSCGRHWVRPEAVIAGGATSAVSLAIPTIDLEPDQATLLQQLAAAFDPRVPASAQPHGPLVRYAAPRRDLVK
jgi:hypothetical protein